MILEEFLTSDDRKRVSRAVEVDALRDRDALQDAALLDIRVSGVWSCAWLLLDCKGALNIRDGNTAVLVVHGLDELTWGVRERPAQDASIEPSRAGHRPSRIRDGASAPCSGAMPP